MEKKFTVEPDFAAEKAAFEEAAAQHSMCLDRIDGGFYVDHATQMAWCLWIHRAAFASNGMKIGGEV